MNIQSWSFNEYCTYVMTCIAAADHNVVPKEVKVIKSFLKDKEVECADSLVEELSIVIKYQTQEERLAEIEEGFSKYITTQEDLKLFLAFVEEVIISDLEVDKGEVQVFRLIKKLSKAFH